MKSRSGQFRQFVLALVLGAAGALAAWFLTHPESTFLKTFLTIVAGAIGFLVGANINLKLGSGGGAERLSGGAPGALLRKQVLLMLDEQRSRLENLAFKLTDDRVRLCADELIRSYSALSEQVKKDISDARPVRRFLNHYGESAVNLVEKYLQLDKLPEGLRNESSQQASANIVTTLSDIKGSFEVLRQRLLENDIFSIETELEVLQKSIALDGLDSASSASRQTSPQPDSQSAPEQGK